MNIKSARFTPIGIKDAATDILRRMSTSESIKFINIIKGGHSASADGKGGEFKFIRSLVKSAEILMSPHFDDSSFTSIESHIVRSAMLNVTIRNSQSLGAIARDSLDVINTTMNYTEAYRAASTGLLMVVMLHVIENYLSSIDPAGEELKAVRELLKNSGD